MRRFRTLLAALTAVASFHFAPPVRAQCAGFVGREGAAFVCGGSPFPALGLNCYYLMTRAAEPFLRGEVDEVLDEARALGASVVRTWAFNDGADQWNALQTAPGAYSERVFAGLDYVVRGAGRRGLKLLLPLVNNWSDYGGMDRYVAWSPTASAHDDFYTDSSCRAWYRDHCRAVLTRVNTLTGVAYRDDPAIFGWELANEPRASGKGPQVLLSWIKEMAAHVKTIDARHLLSTGSEGFYGAPEASRNPASFMSREGVDFLAQHDVPEIDFTSFHAYPDLWGVSRAQSVEWVRRHFADSIATLGRPALLGEFGKRQPLAVRDEHFAAWYEEVARAVQPGRSSAGALFWSLYADSYPDYDGFGVYVPRHSSTVALIEEMHRGVRGRLSGAALFIRGDADCDGALRVSDPIAILEWIFRAGGPACCLRASDSNGDGAVDVSDALLILLHLFAGAPAPPPPFPACGIPTAPAGADPGAR